METRLVCAVIGRDQPGLVYRLSEAIAGQGGNWLDGHMNSIAGRFAGTVLLSVEDGRAQALTQALLALQSQDLQLLVEPAVRESVAQGTLYDLELMGHDRAGIVQDISRALAALKVNIDELTTEYVSGAMAGGVIFKAKARLDKPEELPIGEVQDALEALANELMVDLHPAQANGGR